MKNNSRSIRIYAAILLLALLWRMLGAPVSAEDFRNLKTPFWQARILLSQRTARMLSLWLCQSAPEAAQTMAAEDEMITVYLSQENRLVKMTVEGYVCGVVAAEMPAGYHLEALKAQAVAARTRLLWQKMEGGCGLHSGVDICTDSAHCQGYATLSECREKWGASYEAYRDRLLQAERETAGEWLAYEDKPITVLYHASSDGQTENVQTVFAESLPYLISVESGENPATGGLQQETRLSFEEIAQKLNVSGMNVSAQDVRRTMAIGGYTETGRVSHMILNDQQIKATEFRSLLGLRSTAFSISADEKGITFFQRGYGHGVGMSQAGANSMAANGRSYREILEHYYTGVRIVKP